jgi:hypothetical protein
MDNYLTQEEVEYLVYTLGMVSGVVFKDQGEIAGQMRVTHMKVLGKLADLHIKLGNTKKFGNSVN